MTTRLTHLQGKPAIRIRRYGATACSSYGEPPGTFVHLACSDAEREARMVESASVLLGSRCADTPAEAVASVRALLDRNPGSLVTAVAASGAGTLVGLRDGRIVQASTNGPQADPALPAAAVYTCLRARLPLDDLTVTVRLGGRQEEDYTLRVVADHLGRLHS